MNTNKWKKSLHNFSVLKVYGITREIFFLIGNKELYSRTLPYAEKHKAERKIQRKKKECKDKEKKRY